MQRPDERIRRNFHTELLEKVPYVPKLLAPRDSPAEPRAVSAHSEVLEHGRIFDETEVLVDEGKSQLGGFPHLQRKRQFLAADREHHFLVRIGLVEASQDLDQRGLAGAVLAYEPVDLSGQDLDVEVVKHRTAAERLRDVLSSQDRELCGLDCHLRTYLLVER